MLCQLTLHSKVTQGKKKQNKIKKNPHDLPIPQLAVIPKLIHAVTVLRKSD